MKQMKNIFIQILFMASLLLAGCKDGDPGPTGQTGATGTAGATGAKGTTGTTGLGFDNSVKDGNVAVTLSGKNPSNVDFTSLLDFKYSLDGGSPADDAKVTTDNDGTKTFYVVRYLGAVDEHYNNDYIQIEFQVTSAGVITLDYLYVTGVVINGKDYFGISEGDDGNVTLTGYSYDATTGHLKFNFTMTATSSYSTGYDLAVSGVASVNVYEPLNDIVSGED